MSGKFKKDDGLDHIRQQGYDNQKEGTMHMNAQAWSTNAEIRDAYVEGQEEYDNED